MMHTAIALALFPMVSGFLAFILAAVIAAYRVAAVESAPFVPEYTESETVEFYADLSLSLDVDAEWIALAASPLLQSTRNAIASVRSDRAAVDAWIASLPATVPAVATLTAAACEAIATRVHTSRAAYAARLGIEAARARIVSKVHHTAQATPSEHTAHPSAVKLTSERATFLASVRFGIAAATARRTLQASLTLASDREWREAFASPVESYDADDNAIESLGTLAVLGNRNADETESAIAWDLQLAIYTAALSEAFPVETVVTVAA